MVVGAIVIVAAVILVVYLAFVLGEGSGGVDTGDVFSTTG